jgi:hypothetical protein
VRVGHGSPQPRHVPCDANASHSMNVMAPGQQQEPGGFVGVNVASPGEVGVGDGVGRSVGGGGHGKAHCAQDPDEASKASAGHQLNVPLPTSEQQKARLVLNGMHGYTSQGKQSDDS